MKILDKDYQVKYNLRSMFVWEGITGKPFKIESMLDEYILIYSCLVSVKENPFLDFDEFIDYCSDHPEVLDEFNEYIQEVLKKKELIAESKKKVTENN